VDDTVKTIVASAGGGLVGRTLLHPLDTLKSKVQASPRVSLKTVSVDIFAKEGFRGFYRGFPVAAMGSIPGVALYFTTFHFLQDKFEAKNPLIDFGCGFVAEAVSCVFWVPVDVLKERQQVNAVLGRTSLRQLYKGYWATLAAFGPFSAIYFSLVEQIKQIVTDKESSFSRLAFACGLAGGCAAWATTPLDLAKLRLQVGSGESRFWSELVSIYKNEGGAKALFRGAVPRVAFSSLNSAVTFGSIEFILSRLSS
jgi:inorganic pyrophosphatase/solute carrier family 25 iron transporter 28/37